jgi:hypothetical protein
MSEIDNDLTEEELAALRGDTFEGEEDEAEEEEVSEDAESEEEPEDTEVEEDPRISRLLEQMEASKERNAWLEEQLGKLIAKETSVKSIEPDKPAYDFEAKEEEYVNLIIEGEIAKASKLRSQIDAAKTSELLALIRGEAELTSKKSIAEAQILIEQDKFSKAVEVIESQHPFFNPDHKLYNEEAVDTANSLMNAFIAKGESRTAALKKAVSRILPLYEPQITKSALGSERKSTAGKIAADAANRQPPKTSGVKGESGSLKTKPLSAYTDKEFMALTPAQLRELRGDM